MAANMYRVPASEVKRAGRFGFVQDNGMMVRAHSGSSGFFLFSEVGAGVKPLALVGMWHEILNYMAKYGSSSGIDNRISELPDVYWDANIYKPGERFIGCFPVNDAAQQLVEGAAAMAPGNTITDVGGLLADGYKMFKTFRKPQKKAAPTMANSPVIITFHYLQGKGMTRLGSGKIPFSSIYDQTREKLTAMAG